MLNLVRDGSNAALFVYLLLSESSKAMKVKKVHGFVVTKKAEYVAVRNIKKISIAAWPEMDLSGPKPELVEVPSEPKWDLGNALELCSPGSSVPEPEPEQDLDDPPEREWDVVDSVELYAPGSSFPEPEPEEDLADSVELYVPGPSFPKLQPEWYLAAPRIPEPEPKVESELSRLENYVPLNVLQLEDRLKKCTALKQRHVTNVWPRVFIGDE